MASTSARGLVTRRGPMDPEGLQNTNEEKSINTQSILENETPPELFDIPADSYNIIFLSPYISQGFFFGLYVFVMKMGMFIFLAVDTLESLQETRENDQETPKMVLCAQCLMLPVAVALQEDLIATFTLLSNVKYSSVVLDYHPYATKFKYYLANTLRGIDGTFSLFINFTLLLSANTARALFLNFAALQFLQSIDNMALTLAKEGFFTPTLEEMACKVQEMQLPRRDEASLITNLDSIFFISTFENLLVAWFMIKIA